MPTRNLSDELWLARSVEDRLKVSLYIYRGILLQQYAAGVIGQPPSLDLRTSSGVLASGLLLASYAEQQGHSFGLGLISDV